MAGLFPQEWLDEVMERNNIVDVVSSYVPLTKRGKNIGASVPFIAKKPLPFPWMRTSSFTTVLGARREETWFIS